VLVRRLEEETCPRCGAIVGVGLKEEPTGWKVYRVCLAEERPCGTTRIGSIARSSVSDLDEVANRAEELF
jgi:hypothetical protein